MIGFRLPLADACAVALACAAIFVSMKIGGVIP